MASISTNQNTYSGTSLGTSIEVTGTPLIISVPSNYEAVISTPSNKDKIIIFTYPEIGNMGINLESLESSVPECKAVIISKLTPFESHYQSIESLDTWLSRHEIPLITNVDTRSLCKDIIKNNVDTVTISGSTSKETLFTQARYRIKGNGCRITILSKGVSDHIIEGLKALGAHIEILPYTSSLEAIKSTYPQGILIPHNTPKIQDIDTLKEDFPILSLGNSSSQVFNIEIESPKVSPIAYPRELKKSCLGYTLNYPKNMEALVLDTDLKKGSPLVIKDPHKHIIGIDYETMPFESNEYIKMFIEAIGEIYE